MGALLWRCIRGGCVGNRLFMEIAMDNNHQRDTLARCCSVLCDEINRLIEENAHLAAENERLTAELDALNNALEDDGK